MSVQRVFGIATWIVPLLLIAKSWNLKPKSSLTGAGIVVGIIFATACLSVMGISLALLSFFFVQDAKWAWTAVLTIGGFWLSGGIVVYVGRRWRAAGESHE